MIRSYFNTNTQAFIKKEYANYYSALYPGIESTADVTIDDFSRTSTNTVTIEERYKVNEFWTSVEDDPTIYAEFYPLLIESFISYPESAGRDMPYHLGEPMVFNQSISVMMPEDWNVTPSEATVSGEGFQYANKFTGTGRMVHIEHTYELKQEHIAGNLRCLCRGKWKDPGRALVHGHLQRLAGGAHLQLVA